MTRRTVGRDAKEWGLYRDAADALTRTGAVRYWDDLLNLSMNSPFTYSFSVSLEDIVLEYIKLISYSGPNKGMGTATLEIFEGGQVSGGSPSNPTIRNFVDVDPVPFDSGIQKGVTIDVAGNLVYSRVFVGNNAEVFEDSFGPFVLNKETLYYITLTDLVVNHNENLKIETSIIRIGS